MKVFIIINQIYKCSIIAFFCLLIQLNGFAQDADTKHTAYLGLDFKRVEDEKVLIASLTARIQGKRGRQRVSDKTIGFYLANDTTEILLGEAVTNADGIAHFNIKDGNFDSDQKVNFEYSAVFDGDEEYQQASKQITIMPLNIEMSFAEIDSVKNIVVTATWLDSKGSQMPVEEDVVLYVPGKFSRLKIGEVELVDGEGVIEFPFTLPGDSIGNLKVIAVVEESDDFGTVEISTFKDWGKPRPPVIIERRRGLGDTDAPLWMVYTLIVLMSVVWFHYLYLFFMMYMIKQKGKSAGV